jgi:hypothetical protein
MYDIVRILSHYNSPIERPLPTTRVWVGSRSLETIWNDEWSSSTAQKRLSYKQPISSSVFLTDGRLHTRTYQPFGTIVNSAVGCRVNRHRVTKV